MIVILDGNSIAYRAYHKAPPLTSPDGLPTGAVHIFFTIFEKVRAQLNPSRVFAVFDTKGETKRHQKYPRYKATREAMPEDLAPQIELIQSLLPLAGIPVYCKSGIEADDIIATLAIKADEPVAIVTKDKDLFQLVNDNIKIYDDNTGRLLGVDETKNKYGVSPKQMPCYLSLLGDKSDNIPGVAGVGEITAAKLIQEYGSIDNIYARISEIKGKIKERLERDKEQAYIAKSLIALETIDPLFEPTVNKDDGKLRGELERLGMRAVAAKLLAPRDLFPLDKGAGQELLPDLAQSGLAQTNGGGTPISPCVEGTVAAPSSFVAVEGALWVTDGKNFEPYDPATHYVNDYSYFYDVKTFSRSTGQIYPRAKDYLLISWLSEPDIGVLHKGRLESVGDFITRFLNMRSSFDHKLDEYGLNKLYAELELPVAFILGGMEKLGVRVSSSRVRNVANYLKQQITQVASRLILRAGYEINLNSPKQLSEYLYDRLGITPVSKSNRSTAEEALLELTNISPAQKEIIDDILTYREYSKLYSTYTSPLLNAISTDGRIHTTYKQTGTATGRLSSANPNLQNIPARGEIGKTIRSAFIPAEGYRFVSLDYSQIELRLLAHFSGDTNLINAFLAGDDIHAATAMKIFNKSKDGVTPDLRRLAKAVNFGIIYGLSAFGLSRDAGITQKDAKEFIEAYFGLYKNVREYISNLIEHTKDKGYCETILGRRRFFPEINSRNGLIRQKAERATMNAPLQGSAADIIKAAMIKCGKLIDDKGLDARVCLQIHDELIFEVSTKAVDEFLPLARGEMENAIALNVPLAVNVNTGADWGELK